MKRKTGISGISRFLQRNPAWSQVVCIVGVSLLVILGPILLYGLFFQSETDLMLILSKIPWWPVVLIVLLVAVLSLLQGAAGVSVQKKPEETREADDTGGSTVLPADPQSQCTPDPLKSGPPKTSAARPD